MQTAKKGAKRTTKAAPKKRQPRVTRPAAKIKASKRRTRRAPTGPKVYNAKAVYVHDVHAHVTVQVKKGPGVTFEVEGSEEFKKATRSRVISRTLELYGYTEEVSEDFLGKVTQKALGIFFQAQNVASRVKAKVQDEELEAPVHITINVPVGTKVTIENVEGNVTIGDTEGFVEVHAGICTNTKIGRVADAVLSTIGGKIAVKSVSDELFVHTDLLGNVEVDDVDVDMINIVTRGGEVKIHDGVTQELSMSVTAGVVEFLGKSEDATISVSGYGKIKTGNITNEPLISKTGLGTLQINNWTD
jgi:hypothetical protein